MIHVFEHHEDRACSWVNIVAHRDGGGLAVGHHHLIQRHDILVPQGLQELNFAHGSDGEAVALSLHTDLFEGNHNSSAGIPRFPYLSESTFTDLVEAVVHAVSDGSRRPCNTNGGHRFMIALRRIRSIFSPIRRPAR